MDQAYLLLFNSFQLSNYFVFLHLHLPPLRLELPHSRFFSLLQDQVLLLVADFDLSAFDHFFYFMVGYHNKFVSIEVELLDGSGTLLEVFIHLCSHIHLEGGVDHRKILHLAHKRRIIIERRMGLGGNDRSVVILDVFCIVGE